MTNNYSLTAEKLTKIFGRRLIFKNLDFNFSKGVYGVSGANGSGKSTLVKVISGVLSPTSGTLLHKKNEEVIKTEELHNFIGLVSPYLVMYDEFTAYENLQHFTKIRGVEFNQELIDSLLNDFLIYKRRNDPVKTYSSGMKQRLKYLFALMHNPGVIILDEPTSNLDSEGKETVYKIITRYGKESIVIVASNDAPDLELCGSVIKLDEYKI